MIMKQLVDRVRHARITSDKNQRRQKNGMLALGMSIGCTLGAVAGILLAPRSGKDTRRDVAQRGSDAWNKIRDTTVSTSHRLVTAVEDKGAQVSIAAEKCADAVKEVLHEPVASDIANRLKK